MGSVPSCHEQLNELPYEKTIVFTTQAKKWNIPCVLKDIPMHSPPQR